MKNIEKLIELHGELMVENPYCYCEIAYTRQTEWMAWICTNAREQDPNRKVLATGGGMTADDACAAALEHYRENAEVSHGDGSATPPPQKS